MEKQPRTTPKEAGLSAHKFERVRKLIQTAVDKKQTAGLVVLVARHGKIAFLESYGQMNVSNG
jgi:hypothetical protein